MRLFPALAAFALIAAPLPAAEATASEAARTDARTEETSGALVDRQMRQLATVRTLYVETLNGEGAEPIRDMLIGAFQRLGLVRITENEADADAVLRGSAEDLIFQDYSRFRDGFDARGAVSSSRRESGESDYGSSSFGVGDTETATVRRRRHEAVAAVRIVMRSGEVVWSSTQESDGAKFRGSSADVAARIADDFEEAYRDAVARTPGATRRIRE